MPALRRPVGTTVLARLNRIPAAPPARKTEPLQVMGLPRLLPALFIAALLWGCSRPSVPPEEVASAFWAATLTGDGASVRRLVVPQNFSEASYRAARHNQVYDSVVIGPARLEDDRALVDTRLHGVFYGDAGTVQFDTVATVYQGEWKIDYRATASRMMGAILQDSVSEADAAIRSDAKTLEESLNESIRKDLKTPRK